MQIRLIPALSREGLALGLLEQAHSTRKSLLHALMIYFDAFEGPLMFNVDHVDPVFGVLTIRVSETALLSLISQGNI